MQVKPETIQPLSGLGDGAGTQGSSWLATLGFIISSFQDEEDE